MGANIERQTTCKRCCTLEWVRIAYWFALVFDNAGMNFVLIGLWESIHEDTVRQPQQGQRDNGRQLPSSKIWPGLMSLVWMMKNLYGRQWYFICYASKGLVFIQDNYCVGRENWYYLVRSKCMTKFDYYLLKLGLRKYVMCFVYDSTSCKTTYNWLFLVFFFFF